MRLEFSAHFCCILLDFLMSWVREHNDKKNICIIEEAVFRSLVKVKTDLVQVS